MRVRFRPPPCAGKRVDGVIGDEIGGLLAGIEVIRPFAIRKLVLVELLSERIQPLRIFLPPHGREEIDGPVEVNDVLRLVAGREALDFVALREPRWIPGLVVELVEQLPALRRNLIGADHRLAAVGLLAWHLLPVFVVDFEEVSVGEGKVRPRRIVRDVRFK